MRTTRTRSFRLLAPIWGEIACGRLDRHRAARPCRLAGGLNDMDHVCGVRGAWYRRAAFGDAVYELLDAEQVVRAGRPLVRDRNVGPVALPCPQQRDRSGDVE